MNTNNTELNQIQITINNKENKKYHNQEKVDKAILIIQKFIRRKYMKKSKLKIKLAIDKVLNSQDTVRITPAKFVQPLYLVQRPIFKKIFGSTYWNYYSKFLEGNGFIFLLPLYIFASIVSFLYIFNYYYNITINIFAIILIIPFYLSFYLTFQDQLLILAFSSLECKLYLLIVLGSSIWLTDLFRDGRILNVWLVSFPGLFIIPLADSIPRYLNRTKKIFYIYFKDL